MHTVLFHNPVAGFEQPSLERTKKLLNESAVTFDYLTSPAEKDLSRVLNRKVDFATIVGGDGTIKKIAPHLFFRRIPIVVLPCGTANNIIKSLQLPTFKDFTGLGRLSPVLLDIGLVNDTFFLESTGFGLTARMMELMHFRNLSHPLFFSYQKRKFIESIRLLEHMLETEPATHYNLRLDGQMLSDDFLFVEVMNIPMMGPNLLIAPGADPADGLVDVVVATEEDKSKLKSYFSRRLKGEQPALCLTTYRCHSVAIAWEGTDLHIDGVFFKKYHDPLLGITAAPLQLRFLGVLEN
jgi:diacylglycerol kinase (ATP)